MFRFMKHAAKVDIFFQLQTNLLNITRNTLVLYRLKIYLSACFFLISRLKM